MIEKTSKKTYLFANWKMYLDFDESNILANALANKFKKPLDNIDLAVFPSILSMYSSGQVLHDVGIMVGSQNAYWADKGGYTGEVSMNMLKDISCDYILIGHSERRHIFGETKSDIRKKIEKSLEVGLIPVVCVGEKIDERNSGHTNDIIENQLKTAFENLNIKNDENIFIAYEPVWAISPSDNICDAEEAEKVHCFIIKTMKNLLPKSNIKILYGGSVKANNVIEYISKTNIDGVLIGGASVKLDSFSDIISNTIDFVC